MRDVEFRGALVNGSCAEVMIPSKCSSGISQLFVGNDKGCYE